MADGFSAIAIADLTEVDGAIKRMLRASSNLRPVWQAARRPLRANQVAHLKERKGPSGASWPALAPATMKARSKRLLSTSKAFTKKGKVRKSVQKKIEKPLGKGFMKGARIKIRKFSIAIRTKGAGAGVHMRGGPVGNNATVKARPFFWISDSLMRGTARTIVAHLTGAWDGEKLFRG